MTRFLIALFIKDPRSTEDPAVRECYGFLGNTVGILCNLILFAAKFAVGSFSGSIAIIADAFNNLSDLSSNGISLLGFKLSNKPADDEHPFGHGRLEYLSGLVVSFIIILVGIEFIQSSVQRILHPDAVALNAAILVILGLTILIKLWMSLFYKKISVLISSVAVKANSRDSLNDALITGAALLSLIISKLSSLALDGYIGLALALFILYTGIGMTKEILDPLLGQPPDPVLVKRIEDILMSYDEIIGVHDLIVHNYGPGRVIASVHAEVPAGSDFLRIHDTIDLAERKIAEELRIRFVIHMDPVNTGDERTQELLAVTQDVVSKLNDSLSIHDFRIVPGETHTNLVFDLVVPHSFKESGEKKLKDELSAALKSIDPSLFAVVTIDRSFV
jgi:cation diffusion facilitator family transporter